MKKQKGVTLTGMAIVCIALMLVMLLAFKVVPVYLEYMSIEKQMKSMAEDQTLRAVRRGDLDRAWASRAAVDNITSLPPESIEYTKQGDKWVLSGEYSTKVKLFRNVSACFEFQPTSK